MLGFCFIDNKFSVFEGITVGSETTVPPSFSGFPFPSCHCLNTDVLYFHLRDNRHHRQEGFACRGRTIQILFYTDKVCAVLLHFAEIHKAVSGITGETGEFENKNITDIIFLILDIFHHAVEVISSGCHLAGLSFVAIFTDYLNTFLLGIGTNIIKLGGQRITVHLHFRRYTGIGICSFRVLDCHSVYLPFRLKLLVFIIQ